jgi:tRNA modification GTPase
MFSTEDTIVAIATPAGRGGIGVVRISGPSAVEVGSGLLQLDGPLQPRHATFVRTHGDQVVATCFPAPHSYTGEHVIEISAHGSPVVLRQIVERAMALGARLAEPGEFTLRAFLNGRIDLVQAEAVADLIEAVTPLQARAAFDQLEGTLTTRIGEIETELFEVIAKLEASLDFPDEGYHFVEAGEVSVALGAIHKKIAALVCEARRGRLIREGARVAIAGKPNVGKSSVFNALLRTGRAIVTPIPGTTRDLVTDTADIDGLRLELVDTAGVRETRDAIETEGVERARRAWTTADLLLVAPVGRRRLRSVA